MSQKVEFAADLETPVSAFLKLAPLEPVFLLESAEKNDAIGRFSFLGILPKEYFVLEDPARHIDFFTTIAGALKEMPKPADGRLGAGLVGFLSYHMAALLHPKLTPKPSRFPLAGFVLPSAILTFDHLKRTMFLSSVLSDAEQKDLAKQIRLCLQSPPNPPDSGKSSEPVSPISRNQFYEMVDRAGEHIRSGDIYQVVLSMPFEGESTVPPFQLYRALRMVNPSPYLFYFNFRNEFQFFGSSPETMVRTENSTGNRIVLRPIAGTRKRGDTLEEDDRMEKDLLQDQKEKAEHLMLLDLARNDAGRLGEPGSVKVTEFMKVERYSHVMHLVSTVETKVPGFPPIPDLLRAVFPAGTVSGAPKVRAMQIIDELEPHSRDLYAGSLGYFGAGGAVDHCISIRCMQKIGDRYTFTAGAGIVSDSVPEREYEEIANKAMALRTVLKMAEEGF